MLTRNICSEYGEYNIQCNGIDLVTSRLLRLLLFVRDSRMAADILSIPSSSPRHLPADGYRQTNLADQQYSLLQMHLTL